MGGVTSGARREGVPLRSPGVSSGQCFFPPDPQASAEKKKWRRNVAVGMELGQTSA